MAVDINPAAVRCARINALLNGIEDRVEVRQGDLCDAVAGERFDVVLCNPPFYPGRPQTPLGGAFYSIDFADRFCAALPHHLAADGFALMVLSSDGDITGFETAFRDAGIAFGTVAERDLVSERVRLYRLAHGRRP